MKAATGTLILFVCMSSLTFGASTSAPLNPSIDHSVVPVTLGQSVIALTGPWRFQIGDDPRWANPNFDDSQWETVDLTPTPQTTVAGVPIRGFVTGWTARGHAGYAGFAWYRIRVRISGAAGPLTLLAPEWSDGAFQVFANGRLVGSDGNFSRPIPERYYGKPPMFSLSASDYRSGPDGTTFLAFRFYMTPAGLLHGGTGGMHGPPVIFQHVVPIPSRRPRNILFFLVFLCRRRFHNLVVGLRRQGLAAQAVEGGPMTESLDGGDQLPYSESPRQRKNPPHSS